MVVDILSILVNLRDLFGIGTKLKESIFKNNNQIISTHQPKYGSCKQNELERGQFHFKIITLLKVFYNFSKLGFSMCDLFLPPGIKKG